MRHALITAGTKGLGLQVVEGLLEAGYSATVTYFSDKEKAETLQQKWPIKNCSLSKRMSRRKRTCKRQQHKPFPSLAESICVSIMPALTCLKKEAYGLQRSRMGIYDRWQLEFSVLPAPASHPRHAETIIWTHCFLRFSRRQ